MLEQPIENAHPIHRIAFVGDYTPRQCGIATFTANLCEAMSAEFRNAQMLVGAVNDRPEGYDYNETVRFEIEEKEIDSYRRAADFLNINNVEVVSIQHEFGIFGGTAGSHVLALMRELQMPIVTTLHTVLKEPNDAQRRVMDADLPALGPRDRDGRARRAVSPRNLRRAGGKDRPDPARHSDMPFIDPNFYKDQFGVEGKTVLLTFGLLSPNKGIEYVIEALPAILKENPERRLHRPRSDASEPCRATKAKRTG